MHVAHQCFSCCHILSDIFCHVVTFPLRDHRRDVSGSRSSRSVGLLLEAEDPVLSRIGGGAGKRRRTRGRFASCFRNLHTTRTRTRTPDFDAFYYWNPSLFAESVLQCAIIGVRAEFWPATLRLCAAHVGAAGEPGRVGRGGCSSARCAKVSTFVTHVGDPFRCLDLHVRIRNTTILARKFRHKTTAPLVYFR